MKKYIPIKTLFKEAFLSIFIPHKTFSRIPKNPKLNYRIVLPLMFLSAFVFLAFHLPIVHHRLSVIPQTEDSGVVFALPFSFVGAWIIGSFFFFYLARIFKKNASFRKIEVAVFYLWFIWFLMPLVDLLHPLLGIPYQMTVINGLVIHFSWLFAFPGLAIETVFILKDVLGITGKNRLIAFVLGPLIPILARLTFLNIPHYANYWFFPDFNSGYSITFLAPLVTGFFFSYWLIYKGKYTTLKVLGQTLLICTIALALSTSFILYSPFPTPMTASKDLVKNGQFGGQSRFTHSYTYTSADLESGTIDDNGTSAYNWFTTTYTGITFDFTPANETISDVFVHVNFNSVSNNDPIDPPEVQGCYSPNSGTNWYCSPWTTNVAATAYNFTISSSSIWCFSVSCDTFTAGTNGNRSSGLGSAGTSSNWNSLVSQMGTGSTNQVKVHVLTNSDGAATPAYDDVQFNVVQLEVDYRTTLNSFHYIWYANVDALNPGSSLATDTALTNNHRNSVIRLRVTLISNVSGDLTVNDEAFKLQYAIMQGANCIGGDETWIDVGSTSATTKAWRGYDNPSVTDGAQITVSEIGAAQLESYVEQNNSPTNPVAINSGQWGEWDFVVQNYLALPNTTYCFQMAAASGVNNTQNQTASVITANDVVNLSGKVNLRGKINLR